MLGTSISGLVANCSIIGVVVFSFSIEVIYVMQQQDCLPFLLTT